CFLCHFPSGRPDRPLAGALPCGVRTYLSTVALRAPADSYESLSATALAEREGGAIVWLAATPSLYRMGSSNPANAGSRRIRLEGVHRSPLPGLLSDDRGYPSVSWEI